MSTQICGPTKYSIYSNNVGLTKRIIYLPQMNMKQQDFQERASSSHEGSLSGITIHYSRGNFKV